MPIICTIYIAIFYVLMYVHKGVFVCVEVGVVSRSGSNDVLHKQVEEMRQRLAVSEKEAKKHGEKGGEWDKGRYREIVAAFYFLISSIL